MPKIMGKKRNQQDATLINTSALKRRVAKLEREVRELRAIVTLLSEVKKANGEAAAPAETRGNIPVPQGQPIT